MLRRIARDRAFEANQEIFKEGEAGDGIYFVKSGRVEISARVGQEGRYIFSKAGPGDVFGEMAVIEDKPRSATATAREATSVWFIPRDEMLMLIEQSPGLALALLREVSHRLREFNRQYLDEVLQAERLAVVGRFARSIIHDLKNPLNIIGLTAEMAGMETASIESRRLAKVRIRQQVERISEMVGEILEFTQGSNSTFVLAREDYSAFVRYVLEELRPEAEGRQVRIEMPGPPPAVLLYINPRRLRRVFHNLIHNAAEAMPRGGKVFVRFPQRPGEVVTEIEDTGPGIAPEMAGRLFEAFATHGKVNGTGLGLSICRRILEEHHGWITARSEPGRGAVFSFGLPLSKTDSSAIV